MKNLSLLFVMTIASWAFSGQNTLAGVSHNPEPFYLVEYTASLPSFPDVPQDNGVLCGDVNEDGMINVLDIIFMVNYIMGGNPSPFNQDAADIKADELINILDVISLVNIILEVQGLPCGCVAPVIYDGQSYATVQIGEQCWFKENLNGGTKINSTQAGYQQQDNGTIEKYCYNNDEASCGIYGGLYEWPEAMQYVTAEGAQGICPPGWHIPTDNEWKILEGTADSQFPVGDPEWDNAGWRGLDAGGHLKEAGTTHWLSPNTGAINSSGFTGLPGGWRDYNDGSFNDLNNYGYFCSSSQYSTSNTWYRYLGFSNANVSRDDDFMGYGLSVRCLKGCWPQPTQSNAGPDQLNIQGTSTTLTGNTPEYGTGLWAIKGGTGGTIVTATSPTSGFIGLEGNAYSLTWTISTQCRSSEDTVLISFATGFTCGDTLVDSRDGQSYVTVQIDTQCWMAENLNVGTKINSTQGGFQQTDNGTIEKYCYFNDESNCDIYGGLYEWPEAIQYVTMEGTQGICPAGWYIPTDNEWKILEGTVDSQYGVGDPVWDNTVWRGSDAGGNLKETEFLHWYEPNTGATNSSGFTGLPGGYCYYYDGYSYFVRSNGYFWSSSQIDESSAWFRSLGYDNAGVYRLEAYKDYGFSIRCVNNCSPQPAQANAGPDQLNMPGTATTLSGNVPSNGIGVWHIVGGAGGTIADTTSPTSEFQGTTGNAYSLTWTITTICGSSMDTVAISFAAGFTCGDLLVDDRDWKSYNTVLIGTQCWMVQNLDIGESIASNMGGQLQTDNNIIEKYCFNNSPSMCSSYGGLYEWPEVMQYVTTEGSQGICPAGWHIPSDGEFNVLADFLGGSGIAGGKMKSTGTIEDGTGLWHEPNTGATNESGFTGFPGGQRINSDGSFIFNGYQGYFWSSSQYSTDCPWGRRLLNSHAEIYRDNEYHKNSGFSIRCIKND